MALVDADTFGDVECARIYMAGRLREAQRVEQALTDGGVDYFVEIEKFRKNLLGVIPREYDGAAFYVAAERAESSRRLLVSAGLRSGIIEDTEGPQPDRL